MALASETIKTLEAKIGVTSGCGDKTAEGLILANIASNRENIRLWLVKQGLHYSAVRNALDTSLVAAYIHKPYLNKWRTRVNPNWALLGGSEDDDDGETISDDSRSTNTASDERPATVDAKWLKNLYAQIETTTGKLIDLKLASLKINLDDGAKAQIKSLAESTTVAKILELATPRTIEILHVETATRTNVGIQHMNFDKLLRAMGARNAEGNRLNVWLTGPTGSFKSSAVKAAARALEQSFKSYRQDANGLWTIYNADGSVADLNGLTHSSPFGGDSSLDHDYKVVGHKDANGYFHWTTFLRIFVYGGVYLADEIDNWHPSALLSLNAALANGWISTPIGILQRHSDCCIVAAANTWGLGATSGYVGRTKLDAATLDRFQPKILWPYDEKMERAIAEQSGGTIGLQWHDWVKRMRESIIRQGLHIIASPRATFDGIALLKQGFSFAEVTDMTFAAGLSAEQKRAIGADATPNVTLAETANGAVDAAERMRIINELGECIRNRKVIDAIRLYRNIHGTDLRTAKDAVEQLIENHNEMEAAL